MCIFCRQNNRKTEIKSNSWYKTSLNIYCVVRSDMKTELKTLRRQIFVFWAYIPRTSRARFYEFPRNISLHQSIQFVSSNVFLEVGTNLVHFRNSCCWVKFKHYLHCISTLIQSLQNPDVVLIVRSFARLNKRKWLIQSENRK